MKRKAFLNGEYLPVLLGRERTHIYIYIGKTHEIRFRLSFKASLYIFGALDRIGSESKFIYLGLFWKTEGGDFQFNVNDIFANIYASQ